MVLGAFEPAGEIESADPRTWTSSPTPAFFRRVFEQQEFGRYFLSGLVEACGVVIISVLIAFLAATAVTRFRFRFRAPC
jgi:N,N'-diacetylchitobiose transport system permease protein